MRMFARIFLIVLCSCLVACAGKHKNVVVNKVDIKTQWKASGGLGLGKVETKLAPNFVSYQGQHWVATADFKGRVYVYDAITGKRIWKRSTKKPLSSALGESEDAVLIGTQKGEVLAFNKADGKPLWTSQVSSEVLAAPMGDEAHIAVLSIDSELQGLNAKTGKVEWMFNASAPPLKLVGATDPLIIDGAAFIGFANGQVGIFKLSDGRVIWLDAIAQSRGRSEIDRMVDINGKMERLGQTVYVVTYHGKVAAVDLNELRVLWMQDQSSYDGLAVNSQVVVVSDEHDIITAFDRLTGEVRWKQDKLQGRYVTPPAIYENYVVMGDDKGFVNVLDISTGEWIGKQRIMKSSLRNVPLVDHRGVIFQCQPGRLVKVSITPKRST